MNLGLLYVLSMPAPHPFHLVTQDGSAFGALCPAIKDANKRISSLIDEWDCPWDEIDDDLKCKDCDATLKAHRVAQRPVLP